MPRTLGIDLGTTNSVMAQIHRGAPEIVVNREARDLTPSVVGRGKKGELLIGTAAKARAFLYPDDTIYSIKRFMGRMFADPDVQKALQLVTYKISEGPAGDVRVWLGGGEYSPSEISSLILWSLKKDAEERTKDQIKRAVITVPAYFGERQVAATREAGILAGLSVLRIINEPTAAALAFGLNRDQTHEGKTVLVYDLGGGTFDISILLMVGGLVQVLGIEGDNLLGGDDFDRLVMERLLRETAQQYGVHLHQDKRALQTLRIAAEEVKIELSSQLSQEVLIPNLGLSAVNLELEFTRGELEQIIQHYLDRTIDLTHKAIQDAGLSPEIIDNILLVGGSTLIPRVEEMLQGVFGQGKIRKDVNPMQCVAVGAAIQTALLSEIECPKCQAKNPINIEQCRDCGTSLYENDKVGCPECFMLSDIGENACWKCGHVFNQSASFVPPRQTTPVSVQTSQTCPHCGKPNKLNSIICEHCRKTLVQGGLKCPHCGELNPPGVPSCQSCGLDMLNALDVTPKDIGIELEDRQMAIIIPKGTHYPIEEPIRREFYTSTAGQRRLEVYIYEGANPVANQNELLGIVTMGLPEGLPRDTPVSIGLGLDADRTLTVAVKLRTSKGEAKNVRIRRYEINPEKKRRIEEYREKVTRFIDKWEEELTEAEWINFNKIIDQLDQTLIEGNGLNGQALDSLLENIDKFTEIASSIRGSSAFITATLVNGGKYLSQSQREQLIEWEKGIHEARERGNWLSAETIANVASEAINQLPSPLLLVIYSRTFANQNSLSPSLAHRIYSALRNVDEGFESNDQSLMGQGIDTLFDLWDEVQQELDKQNIAIPPIVRPSDKKKS